MIESPADGPKNMWHELGTLSATLKANMETQAVWRDSVKAMLTERMDTLESDMRDFKAEIRADMKVLQETINSFRSKVTIGKAVLVSVTIAVGAVLVLVALGFQEGLAWMGKAMMKFFGWNV